MAMPKRRIKIVINKTPATSFPFIIYFEKHASPSSLLCSNCNALFYSRRHSARHVPSCPVNLSLASGVRRVWRRRQLLQLVRPKPLHQHRRPPRLPQHPSWLHQLLTPHTHDGLKKKRTTASPSRPIAIKLSSTFLFLIKIGGEVHGLT